MVSVSAFHDNRPAVFRTQWGVDALEVNQHAFRFAICGIGIAPEIFTDA